MFDHKGSARGAFADDHGRPRQNFRMPCFKMSSCSRRLRQWWGRLIYLRHDSISGAGKPLCALRDLPGKHESAAFLCSRRPQKNGFLWITYAS